MMKKIILILIAGVLVFSGFGVAAVTNNKATTMTNSLAITDNHPPDEPVLIGPTPTKVGVEYKINIVTIDPDGDNIANYTIDWGDNNVDVIEGPFPSSVEVVTSYTWYKAGWYIVRCKANDIYGAESEWREYLLRIWGKQKSIKSLSLQFSQSQESSQQLSSIPNSITSSSQQDASEGNFAGLEEIINDIITRFHDAEKQDEKIAILKELIVVLDKYGLLPEDVTVEEAQELIVSGYLNAISSNGLQSGDESSIAGNNSNIVNNNDFVVSKSKNVLVNKETGFNSNGGLADTVHVECIGTHAIEILLNILGRLPAFTIEVGIWHYNNESISVNQHYTLSTQDGRVLYDFYHNLPWKLQPNWGSYDCLFLPSDWEKKNYMWGRFNLKYRLYIPDDGSSKTLVFHGFVFKVGAIIFNPNGEVINNININVQSNSQQSNNQQSSNSLFFKIVQRLLNTR